MSSDNGLSELVARALEAIEREGPSAFEALCRAHPGQAAALRARVEQLRVIGFLGTPPQDAPLPEVIGGFRILRRLGSGGMGVVFLAEQEGLQRRVALKLVRPDLLYFPGARERFAREVEAVARLAHPGIVPVHAGGEDHGLPYYAMELVRGASLEELLVALAGSDASRLTGAQARRAVEALVAARESAAEPGGTSARSSGARSSPDSAGEVPLYSGSWCATALRIARAVAAALEHAHGCGVVHRDIKPSNIMLTPDGRVLLLDFGLATAAGSARLTGTGAQLGSLAWMSPEQVRGEHATLDGRTDIYSLGATLYELLALRSPFAGGDLEATRRHILDGRVIPLRDLNAAVSRDAETVCQRAMDVERERRYAAAAAFGEDLDNLLALRPVNARRAGLLLGVRRWTQRHPAAGIAIVAGLLLFVGAPIVYAWQQRAARLDLGVAYDEADAQRARAEVNLARAQRAVDVLLTQVAEEDLLHLPNLEPVRRRLLESALSFYEEFLAERSEDPALKRLVATAADRCGYLLIQLGRPEEALALHERQAGLARELLDSTPDDDALLALLARAQAGQATSLLELGRLDEARRASSAGLAVRQERSLRAPDDWAALRDVEESLGQQSAIENAAGDDEAALRADREVVAWSETLLQRAATEEQRLAAVAGLVASLSNMVGHLRAVGRDAEALQTVDRAIALSAPHLQELAEHSQHVQGAVNVRMLLLDIDDGAELERRIREAIAVLEVSLQRFPQHVMLRRMLATACNNLGRLLLSDPERRSEAQAALEQAIEELRRIVADTSGVPAHVAALGGSLVNLGAIERERGDALAARARFEEALQLAGTALELLPGDGTVRSAAFNSAWFLGLTHLDLGDASGCAAAAEELLRMLPEEGKPLRIAAGLFGRAAAAVAGEAELQDTAAAWRARGLHALRLAIDSGWENSAALDSASDLEELRALPEFAQLRAAAPAEVPTGAAASP